ncbi:hypothetical protein SAMN04490355_103222 [Pelosinus propionicus DSM 13327]|uniref:Uncharacterized protein n=1 Tax=Pelosinus propionicus DSM 13327 TaxID=1123291 RepID=A0A1I4MC57_9FIRM|nr:hypothetical protein SAMN04490355_103222 [Pelosinus propionicus DSM 13327]
MVGIAVCAIAACGPDKSAASDTEVLGEEGGKAGSYLAPGAAGQDEDAADAHRVSRADCAGGIQLQVAGTARDGVIDADVAVGCQG